MANGSNSLIADIYTHVKVSVLSPLSLLLVGCVIAPVPCSLPNSETWIELPGTPENAVAILPNTSEKGQQTVLDVAEFVWFENHDGLIDACQLGWEVRGCG